MGKSQCPVCGHAVSGFEQHEFEHAVADHNALVAALKEAREAAAYLWAYIGDKKIDCDPAFERRWKECVAACDAALATTP